MTGDVIIPLLLILNLMALSVGIIVNILATLDNRETLRELRNMVQFMVSRGAPK